MKIELKIPKGWRRVTRGKVKKGDRYSMLAIAKDSFGIWEKTNPWNVGAEVWRFNGFVIRRAT